MLNIGIYWISSVSCLKLQWWLFLDWYQSSKSSDVLLSNYLDIHLANAINAINKLRPGQNGRHFPDDILKCIFLNENVWISIKISPKFVPKGPINNIPALVQIMAWRRPGDKPLSEPMLVSLPTHLCVTRPQWVNTSGGFVFMGSSDNWSYGTLQTARTFVVGALLFVPSINTMLEIMCEMIRVTHIDKIRYIQHKSIIITNPKYHSFQWNRKHIEEPGAMRFVIRNNNRDCCLRATHVFEI